MENCLMWTLIIFWKTPSNGMYQSDAVAIHSIDFNSEEAAKDAASKILYKIDAKMFVVYKGDSCLEPNFVKPSLKEMIENA